MKKILITLTVLVLLVSPLMATTKATNSFTFNLDLASSSSFKIGTELVDSAIPVTNWSSANDIDTTSSSLTLIAKDGNLAPSNGNESKLIEIWWAVATSVGVKINADVSALATTATDDTGANISLCSGIIPTISGVTSPSAVSIKSSNTQATEITTIAITEGGNIVEQFGYLTFPANGIALESGQNLSSLKTGSNSATLVVSIITT